MSHVGDSIVIIPARRASTRLPNKLLLAESGQPLLTYALKACLQAQVSQVVAAVDCQELADIALSAGAHSVLTDPALPSGSDRAWAALKEFPDAKFIVNVQGDEPELESGAIQCIFDALRDGASVATLCAPLPQELEHDSAAVKVVRKPNGDALYFSRSLIPFPQSKTHLKPRLHMGIYGYRREALESFAQTAPTPLELSEGLEQLRFLESGIDIKVLDWPHAFPGIDTRADYDAFLNRLTPPPQT